jgi:DNA-binding XRE family transcriptional regulator
MKQQVDKLKMLLKDTLPKCTVEVDAPDQVSANWWIDVHAGKKRVAVEYQHGKGFGIFGRKAGYGEGPIEVYRTPELAVRRLAQLFRSTQGEARLLTLKSLRELYDCSQVELAQKVGVKQSAISRFEHRSEVKLGTLAAAVKALGGELEVRARFPDSDVAISVKD